MESSNGSVAGTDAKMDSAPSRWMNMRYVDGFRAWQSERLIASLLFSATRNKFVPRTLRCPKGWRKVSPSFSRKPQPWTVWK